MSFYVLVTEKAVRIHVSQNTNEVIEVVVKLAKVFRPKRMSLSPVRSSIIPDYHAFEAFKQLSIGHV